MLDDVGIIHMNGRIYDPTLGRFLQADPFIQAPSDTQSLNRYAYVRNNPLNKTDPSGFVWWWVPYVIKAIVAYIVTDIVVTISINNNWSNDAIQVVAIVASIWAGGGFSDGGTTAALSLKEVALIATLEGISSMLQGGKFGNGFLRAGITAGLGTWGKSSGALKKVMSNDFGNIAVQATIGGTASELTGGKFKNGAAAGAFAAAVSTDWGGRKPTHQEVTYARLANGVYDPDFQGADGYIKSGDSLIDDETGLQSTLFVNEETEHSVLAFTGTNDSSDWSANLNQAFGKGSEQYRQALRQAGIVYKNTGGNVHFVGHSLGGSLAAASAIMTGGSATTFNAAGVHSNTVGGATSTHGSIAQFNSAFDVMQIGNALTPASARGAQISLGSAGTHGMGDVCRAMGC